MAVPGFGLFLVAVAGCGWLWLVVGGCWMVLGGWGRFWLVACDFGWFWLVACFITNTKKRARQSLFWPLINSEIEEMIKRYPTCHTFWNCQPSEPFINYPIPNQACTKIAADSFHLYRHYYLLMISYYSKFIIIETLKNLNLKLLQINVRKWFHYLWSQTR